jgi:hypothetical protein
MVLRGVTLVFEDLVKRRKPKTQQEFKVKLAKLHFLLIGVLSGWRSFRVLFGPSRRKYGVYRRRLDGRVYRGKLLPEGEVGGVSIEEDGAVVLNKDDGGEGGDAEGRGEGGFYCIYQPVTGSLVSIGGEEVSGILS